MKLIDADKLYDALADKLEWLIGYDGDIYLSVGACIHDEIAEQPEVCNMEKVLSQLNDRAEDCRENARKFEVAGMEHASRKMYAKAYSYEDAIKIVKGGGIDE